MDIAIVVQHYPPYLAGAELQAQSLARALAAHSGGCDVITTRYISSLPTRSDDGAVRIRRLSTLGRANVRSCVNFATGFFYLIARGGKYRAIHAKCLSPFSLGAILGAKIRGRKTILTVCCMGEHGDIPTAKEHRLGRFLWWGFMKTDIFVAQTPVQFKYLLEQGIPKSRVETLPNMLQSVPSRLPSIECRAGARAKLRIPDRPTVLFVGRLVLEKGLAELRAAWEQIRRKHDATLMIVGEGPEEARLASWADESKDLSDSVRLLGRQTPMDTCYCASDILIMPSHSEAFGNVVAEAMSYGLAVITTPVGLAQEWIENGRNGLLVDGSAQSLVDASQSLLADAGLSSRLGEHAHHEALDLFSPAQVLPYYLDLYERVSGSKSEAKPGYA
jgi:glycosyltransferase involved in cell wall biosynthesis